MIRVLLVDDQRLVRAGLRMLCGSTADLEVVAEADHGEDAVRFAAELLPDVVLMDLRMPGVDGATATRRILDERPDTRVVVLTTFDDDDHLYPALSAGACGFLAKDVTPDELLDGIRRAASGGHPFSPDVLRRVVIRASRSASGSVPGTDLGATVSEREREILGLLAHGLSNAEIATHLHLGPTTVKAHISALMDRTGSPNRVRLAVLAARSGLLPD